MGGFSNFAISFSIISILTGAVILYNLGLELGGPAAVGLGWPLVTIFTLMIAATMAEIASAYPTAGGLYYWASKLRNKDWGWWTAWLNLGGQVSIVAGINYSAAFYLTRDDHQPARRRHLRPDGRHVRRPERDLDHGHPHRHRDRVQRRRHADRGVHERPVGVVAHRVRGRDRDRPVPLRQRPDATTSASCSRSCPDANADGRAVGAGDPVRRRGRFALSLLQSQWTYTGYDASAHVAEETVFARRASAWGVFLSVAVSAVAGYIVLVALTLKMTTPADVLANSGGVRRSRTSSEQNLGGGLDRAGRAARRRCRVRDDVLRVLVDRVGRPDAVRVQPRRRDPRQRLAQAGQQALANAEQRRRRDQHAELAADPARLRAHQGPRRRSRSSSSAASPR